MLRKLLHLETGYFCSYMYQLANVQKPNEAWSSYHGMASMALKVDQEGDNGSTATESTLENS